MKVQLDGDDYIEVDADIDKKLNLVFKTKKDSKTTLIISAKLNGIQLNQLIAALVSQKLKVD